MSGHGRVVLRSGGSRRGNRHCVISKSALMDAVERSCFVFRGRNRDVLRELVKLQFGKTVFIREMHCCLPLLLGL